MLWVSEEFHFRTNASSIRNNLNNCILCECYLWGVEYHGLRVVWNKPCFLPFHKDRHDPSRTEIAKLVLLSPSPFWLQKIDISPITTIDAGSRTDGWKLHSSTPLEEGKKLVNWRNNERRSSKADNGNIVVSNTRVVSEYVLLTNRRMSSDRGR